MKRTLIILLNLHSIAISIYWIYADYVRKGKFELIDSGLFQDGDGIGLNLFATIIILLGSLSIVYQTKFSHPVIKVSNLVYGIFVLLVGMGYFLELAANAGNHHHTSPNPIPGIILYLVISGIIAFNGFLILTEYWSVKPKLPLKNNSQQRI